MKREIQSYVSFTRTERLGIVALSIILLALIIVRATMHFWVKPEDNSVKQKELATAWAAFKSNQRQEAATGQAVAYNNESSLSNAAPATITPSVTNNASNSLKDTVYHTPTVRGHLFPFNPNTLDSAGFIRLGLREKTTAILLHWRAKGKVFRRKEELKKVYTLTPEDYQRLEPYILLP